MIPFELLVAAGVEFEVCRTYEGTCVVTGPGTTHFVYTPPEQIKVARYSKIYLSIACMCVTRLLACVLARNMASWTSLQHSYKTGVSMSWALYELSKARNDRGKEGLYNHRDVWWLSTCVTLLCCFHTHSFSHSRIFVAFAKDPLGYILCAAYADARKYKAVSSQCRTLLQFLRKELDTFDDKGEVARIDAFFKTFFEPAPAASSASSSSSSSSPTSALS